MSSTLAKPVLTAFVVLAVISDTVLPAELPPSDEGSVAAFGAGASGLSASRRYRNSMSMFQTFICNEKSEK